MPEQLLATYIEKGFFAAVGFIFTGILGLFMFNAKQNKEFRVIIHKKIDRNAQRVIDNHPSKDELSIYFDALNDRISDIREDIKYIKDKL